MKLIDLHCDTIYKLMSNKESNLRSNCFGIDIEKLKTSESLVQTFALFVDTYEHNNVNTRCNSMLSRFIDEINNNSNDISLVKDYRDIEINLLNKKISALLSIEEGAVLEGNLENLVSFYNAGVRMMTLTWNYKNEIGCPHSYTGCDDKGLTEFGFEVVSNMNNLGMIIDVSHLSDKGFYDVANQSKQPFIATHSNSRTIKDNSRNLTDDMLRTLGNKGGLTGINFFSRFLGDSNIGKIDDMISHIKHIINIAGIDAVSIGTDFDGIDSEVEIKDISQMYKLEEGLRKSGLNYTDIEKIFYKNALRIIKEVL